MVGHASHLEVNVIAKLVSPTVPSVAPEEVLTLAFGAYPMLGDAGDPHDQFKI